MLCRPFLRPRPRALDAARAGVPRPLATLSATQLNDLFMRAVEPRQPARPEKPKISSEEKAIERKYGALIKRRHMNHNKDLHRKLRLKWAAIHALPTVALRTEALSTINPLVPLYAHIPTHTPPTRGVLAFEDEAAAIRRPDLKADSKGSGGRKGLP